MGHILGLKRCKVADEVRDVSNTYEDPLARSVRRRLRMNGIASGIPCVTWDSLSESNLMRKAQSRILH